MSKYRVYLVAVAETVIEVEAEDGDEAVETALMEGDFPYFPGGMSGDLGDWNTLSELFPDQNKSEDDWELIGE